MPKTRMQVAQDVYLVFREAEAAAESSAAAISRCLATLVEARGRAKLSPCTGAEVMELLAQSASGALDVRRQILTAHPMLDAIARQLGIEAFGPDKNETPNSPMVPAIAGIRAVARAA